MVVGIDVFHSKSAKAGSIGGMVSSLNDSLSRYYSAVVIQKQGQELIDALKVAFIQSLIRYVYFCKNVSFKKVGRPVEVIFLNSGMEDLY